MLQHHIKIMLMIDAELQRANEASLHDDNSDLDEDDEQAYYNETDVLVEDDEEESIDDVDEGEVDDNSNTGCPMDDNEPLDAMECEDTMMMTSNLPTPLVIQLHSIP